jgi:hypothetical protein
MPKAVTKTLPQSVVEEDHRLEKTVEESSQKLGELRWHWTLDVSNPERVSMYQYAKSVERSTASIHAYAHGWEIYTASTSKLNMTEAMNRARTGKDRECAMDAVADTYGVKFSSVATTKKYRDEAREVLRRAQEASVENGTTLEEEATRIARLRAKEEYEEELEEEELEYDDDEEDEDEEDDSPPLRTRTRRSAKTTTRRKKRGMKDWPAPYVDAVHLTHEMVKYESHLDNYFMEDATEDQMEAIGSLSAAFDRVGSKLKKQEKKRRLSRIHLA